MNWIVTFGFGERQETQVIADDLLVSLVERASAGDADAWEALYRRAYPGMLGYANRRLGVDRGADAVAEAMARAVARIHTFRWHGGGFDAWLYGILRHVVLDTHRSRAREARRRVPGDTAAAGPLEHVLASEEATAVRAAFETLGADDREVLELRVVAGLSAEDVGRLMGKRAGAVRMAQSRALARAAACDGDRGGTGVNAYDDERLLDSLGAALRIDAEPSEAEVAALRSQVTSIRRRVAPVAIGRTRPLHQVLRAAAIVVAVIAGVGVLASAHGSELSPVLRPAARALGISVDSPELQAAKAAMGSLRSALLRDDEQDIARGMSKLVDAVRTLDDRDRSAIRDDAVRLLTRADEELRRLAALRVQVEPLPDVVTATPVADDNTSSPEHGPAATSGSAAGAGGAVASPAAPAGVATPAMPGAPTAAPPPAGSGDGSDDWSSPEEEHEDEPPEPAEPTEGADD